MVEDLAMALFIEEIDKRLKYELLIFCGIALALGIVNLLIRGAKAKLVDKKSRML